jgi:hypothetical protein
MVEVMVIMDNLVLVVNNGLGCCVGYLVVMMVLALAFIKVVFFGVCSICGCCAGCGFGCCSDADNGYMLLLVVVLVVIMVTPWFLWL